MLNDYSPDSAEREYLENYDPGAWPRPSVTADLMIVAEKKLLLVRRGGFPYRGYWALPGGFCEPGEPPGGGAAAHPAGDALSRRAAGTAAERAPGDPGANAAGRPGRAGARTRRLPRRRRVGHRRPGRGAAGGILARGAHTGGDGRHRLSTAPRRAGTAPWTSTRL